MFLLKLWNKQYGDDARFIAYDESTKKYTEFSTDNPTDVAWVSNDLTKNPEYKDWESFEDEPVNYLEDVMM